jgi:transcriptional regulator GlxA family with amidase domain
MPSIAIVAFPNCQALDVSGPMDAFAEANSFLDVNEQYRLSLVGPASRPFRASNGMLMLADVGYEEAGSFDLVLVVGGPSLPSEIPSGELLDCVRRLSAASKRYGSVCTGAFVLGYAGLLNGRRATTHWQNARDLADRFPLAEIEPDKIFVKDGALLTSAGVTAGIDLALSIIHEEHGSAVSLAVAKRLVVVAQRQGGQSQFSPYVAAPADNTSPLATIFGFVMGNLKNRLSVKDLAEHVGMSRRSFTRFFAEEAKLTPADFVEQARLDAARNLLEGSSLALKEVAFECGFGSPHRMRQVFARQLGISPGQYRASFRRD